MRPTTPSHNKKRNVGLLYEFLIGTISRSLVEGNKRRSSVALKIIKKHFRPGTELYNELRLFRALAKTSVSSDSVAGTILSEARTAARNHDANALDRQKSLLIKDINHLINESGFYDQEVNEYRLFATIQTLLNGWRSKERDIGVIAEYEDKLVKHLTEQREVVTDEESSEEQMSPGTSQLMMRVMMSKLNEKYSTVLSESQRALIKAYAASTVRDDEGLISECLNNVKSSLEQALNDNINETHDQVLREKMTNVRQNLLNESVDSTADENVSRFMMYARLLDELQSTEEE